MLKESMAELTFPKSGTRVDDIGISVDDKMKMSIYYPRWMNKKWRYSEMEWKEVCAAIEEAYVRREEADYDGGPYHVRFRKETDVLACLADVKLPGRKGLMKGFRLKARGKEIIISLPKWMDRWRDASYTWTGLCSMMKKEFNAWRENGAGESAGVGSSTEKSSTAETAEKNTAAESMAAEKQVFPAGEEIPTSEAREPEAAQPGQSGPEKEEEKSEAGKSEAKEKMNTAESRMHSIQLCAIIRELF